MKSTPLECVSQRRMSRMRVWWIEAGRHEELYDSVAKNVAKETELEIELEQRGTSYPR